jgi:ActR/RegA family two-component response regulator
MPIREVRSTYCQRALELHDGNLTATARALGVALNTLKSYLSGT